MQAESLLLEETLNGSQELLQYISTILNSGGISVTIDHLKNTFRKIGAPLIGILNFIKGFNFKDIKKEYKDLIKKLVKTKNQLKQVNESLVENIIDLIRSILSSKIFWIVLLVIFATNVVGAVSAIASMNTMIGVSGSSMVTIGSYTGASSATLSASIGSEVASAFINLFLGLGAGAVAYFK